MKNNCHRLGDSHHNHALERIDRCHEINRKFCLLKTSIGIAKRFSRFTQLKSAYRQGGFGNSLFIRRFTMKMETSKKRQVFLRMCSGKKIKTGCSPRNRRKISGTISPFYFFWSIKKLKF